MSKELINALMDEKNQLFAQLNALAEENKTRDLSTEEIEKFNTMETKYGELKAKADGEDAKMKRQLTVEAMQAELFSRQGERPRLALGDSGVVHTTSAAKAEAEKAELFAMQKKGYDLFCRGAINSHTAIEKYNLRADVQVEGGYVMMPQQMMAGFMEELVIQSILMPRVTVLPALTAPGTLGQITTTNIGRPTRGGGEKEIAANDTRGKFGAREMTTRQTSLSMRLTTKFAQGATIDTGAYVNSQMAGSFGREGDYEIILGDGIDGPLGFATPNANGVPASRHFSTGHTNATTVHPDNLFLLADQIHESLLAGAAYIMKRSTQTQFRLSKASTAGTYLWQPSLVAGSPDTFNGYPVLTTDNFPGTIQSGGIVAAMANLKEYWWLPCNQVETLVNPYKYTREIEYSQTIYNDGQPRRPEAFAISKMP